MQKIIMELSTKRSRRKLLKRVSALLCAFVMLFTIHTLKRNADTLEHIPMCGYAEHEHDESCYDGDVLICGREEHVHTDACFQQRPDEEAIAAFEEEVEIDLPLSDEPVPEETEWTLGEEVDAPETALTAPVSTAPVAFALGEGAMLSRIIEVMGINVRMEDIIEVGAVENDEAHTGLITVERAKADFRVRTRKDFVETELALITADDILIVALADGVAADEKVAPEPEEESEEPQAEEEAVPATVVEESEEPQAEEEPEPESVIEENEEQAEEESEPESETEENEEPQAEEESEPESVTEENEEPQAEEEAEPANETEENEEPQAEEEAEPESVSEENEEEQAEEEAEPEIVTEENEEQTEEEAEPESESEENEQQAEEEPEPESVIEENEEQAEEEAEPATETEENEEPQAEEEAEPANETEENEEPQAEEEAEPATETEENEEQAEEEAESEPVTEENNEEQAEEEAEPEPVTKENEEQAEEGSEPESESESEESEEQAEEGSEPESETEESEEQQTEEDSESATEAEESEKEQTEEEAEPESEESEQQGDEESETEEGEDQSEDAPSIAMPAQEFEGRTDYVRVTVTAPEGAFPEGTTMVVVDVEDEKTLTDIEDTVSDDFVAVKRVHAVDITFYDADGNEIEPLVPIAVVMTVEEIEKQQEAVVVHVDGEGATEVVESQSETPAGETELTVEMPATETPADAAQTQPEDTLAEEAGPETETEAETETEPETGDETESEVETEPETEPGTEPGTEPEPEAEPKAGPDLVIEPEDEPEAGQEDEAESVAFTADSFSVYAVVVTETIETKFIDAGGETWNISVGFTKEANIPAGATLEVSEVEDESYLADAEAALDGGQRVTMARFFDIRIMNGEEEVQPERPVSVSITLDNSGIEAIDAADDHVVDSGETAVCAVHFDGETPQVVAASESEDAVVFDASGFSVWGVLYTVDFYYGNYEYHLTGEGNMTLSALFEVLAIEADAALAQQVVFTDPELVDVVRMQDGSDWLLTSLAPFSTEEKLTITMADGTVYEIKVTDEQYAYRALVNDGNMGYFVKAGDNNLFVKYSNSDDYQLVGGVVIYDNQIVEYKVPVGGKGYSVTAKRRSDSYRMALWLKIKDNIVEKIHSSDNPEKDGRTTTWQDRDPVGDALFIAYFAPSNAKVIVFDNWDSSKGNVTVSPYYNNTNNYKYGYRRPYTENGALIDEGRYLYSTDNTTLTATPNGEYFFKGWYDDDGALYSTSAVLKTNEVNQDIVLTPVFEKNYKYNVIANTVKHKTDNGNTNVTMYPAEFSIPDVPANWFSNNVNPYATPKTEWSDLDTERFDSMDLCSFRFPVKTQAKSGNEWEFEFAYWLKDDGTAPVVDGTDLAGFQDSNGNMRDKYNGLDSDTTFVAFYKPKGDYIVRINKPAEGGQFEHKAVWHWIDGTRKVEYNNKTLFEYYFAGDRPLINAIPADGWYFDGWYNNGTEKISSDQFFNVYEYVYGKKYDNTQFPACHLSTELTPHLSDLNLTPVFKRKVEYFNVWFDGSDGIGGGEVGNDTFFTRINGKNGIEGSTSVYMKVAKQDYVASDPLSGWADVTLPSTAVNPQSQGSNKFELQGWYEIYTGQYYNKGETATIYGDAVFYADWMPSNYNIGQSGNLAPTVDTSSFITTRMFDYNNLFNMDSIYLDLGQSSTSMPTDAESLGYNTQKGDLPWTQYNKEYWYMNGDSSDFIFMSTVSGKGRSLNPYGRDEKNQNRETSTNGKYYTAIPTQGLLTSGLRDKLFDNESETLGKKYLGTANHLYQYDAETGYYYYDSDKNAASYNQGAGRFYVYNYTNKTNKSNGGDNTDFLPYNYGSSEFNEMYGAPNYWFGMSSRIDFFLPNAAGYRDQNGVTGNRSIKGDEMVYKFAGDDDVWVFVDGNLVLDMGGVHGKIYGEINFSQGTWTIAYNGADKTLDSRNIMSYSGGSTLTGTLDGLKEGDHTLTLYYLERGASQSNCAIYFNIAPRYSLQFHKVDASTNSNLGGATFGVYTDPECTVAANVWDTYTGARTNIFTTGDSGYVHCSGLVAGKTYYIKELSAPANYPDVSEEVIALTLDSHGNPTVSSTADTNAWTMAGVKSSEAEDSDSKGTFMLYLTVKNRKETNISAQKIWAMIDGSQYSRNEDCEVTVKLQRYSLTEGNGEEIKHTVRLIQRYYANGDAPSNRDTDSIRVYAIRTEQVSRGGSITFTASAANDGVGIASVASNHGYVSASNTTGTGSQHFYKDGGWSEATKSGTYTLSNVQSDTDIYITYIGSPGTADNMGMTLSNISKTDGEGTHSVKSEDGTFNSGDQVNGQDLQVTLNKENHWKHTWTNLETVANNTQYYYYVKEISSSSNLSQNKLLADVPAYVTTYSSDGLSGGGTISVRNTLQAIKVKLRKRDTDVHENNLQGVGFKIYTASEYEAAGFEVGSASVIETNASHWLESDKQTYDSTKKLFVSDELGRFYTGYLPLGTYYIVEVEKPAGYGELAGAVKIEVTENGLQYWLPDESYSRLRRIDSEGYYNLYIDNAKKHDTLVTPASVTFDKQDNGGRALEGATFTLYSDAQLTEVVTTYSGGSFAVSTDDVIDGEGEIATTLGDLLGEAESKTFYLKETAAPAGYTIASPNDVYEITVGKTVDDTEVLNADVDAFVTTTTFSMSVKKGEETLGSAITVVNTPIEIEVVKVIKGTSTPLTGAEFTVVMINENDDNPVLGEDNRPVYSETKPVDENGRVSFSALPVGRYKLDETKVPDGYIKAQGVCRFTVAADGTTDLDQTTVQNQMIALDGGVFTVQNEQGVTLPSTGGSGTALYCVGGAALALLALALLLRKRARGETD